jgi:hypothetical protein
MTGPKTGGKGCRIYCGRPAENFFLIVPRLFQRMKRHSCELLRALWSYPLDNTDVSYAPEIG